MSSTQPQRQEGSQRAIRILSLDAGGVRSLWTITVLKRIMNGFNATRAPRNKLEPWQLFDMIGGTETGGLLAIMLGRLRMSLDDCEETFRELCTKIYQPQDDPAPYPYKPAKFSSEVLNQTLKVMVNQRQLEGATLQEPDPSCKVFTIVAEYGRPGYTVLASWSDQPCKMWEACVASTASPGLFDPVVITPSGEGPYYPFDSWQDPLRIVDIESDANFPGRDRLVISIGSGTEAMHPSLGVALDSVFHKDPNPFEGGMLFRFNQDTHALRGLRECFNKFELIHNAATSYCTSVDFQSCIDKLRQTF